MEPGLIFRLLADLVLVVHFGFVLFVVVGLILILLGGWLKWPWVRRPLFRWLHLGAIGVVVAQAWLGMLCPLTVLEANLREAGGQATYPGSFIGLWVSRLLYYDLPPWVFTVLYSLFFALVVIAWVWVRPGSSARIKKRGQ